MNLSQLEDITKSNNFDEFFEQIGGLGVSSRSFSIQQSAPITQ